MFFARRENLAVFLFVVGEEGDSMVSICGVLFLHVFIALVCRSTHSLDSTTLGNVVLQEDNYSKLNGHRVAVLTNPTGVYMSTMAHIVDDMQNSSLQSNLFTVVMVLSAEHGFRGEKQAETGDPPVYTDEATGLPVFSAYSLSLKGIEEILVAERISCIVVDIQDVGTRLYTFIWTMYNVMLATSNIPHQAIEIIICDRPNPLGGVEVDGPMIYKGFESGYGRVSIPFIHGMTIGELGQFFNSQFSRPLLNIQVLKMINWTRPMTFSATNLVWIPPSPNLPTVESALAYASTVFLEATSISEGRGTCTPFTLFGAPFLSSQRTANALNAAFGCSPFSLQRGSHPQVKGGRDACFRATYFQPMFQKYNNSVVQGVQYLYNSEVGGGVGGGVLGSFRATVTLLKTLKLISTDSNFLWDGSWFGHPGTELVDQYAGTDQLRLMLDAGDSVDAIVDRFTPDRVAFLQQREKFLLY